MSTPDRSMRVNTTRSVEKRSERSVKVLYAWRHDRLHLVCRKMSVVTPVGVAARTRSLNTTGVKFSTVPFPEKSGCSIRRNTKRNAKAYWKLRVLSTCAHRPE